MLCQKCADREDLEDWEKTVQMKEGTPEIAKDIGLEISVDCDWFWCQQCGTTILNGKEILPNRLKIGNNTFIEINESGVFIPDQMLKDLQQIHIRQRARSTKLPESDFAPVICVDCKYTIGYEDPDHAMANVHGVQCPACAHREFERILKEKKAEEEQ